MTGQQSPIKDPIGAGRAQQRRRVAGICLALAAITFAVFGQTLRHDFVDYDDNVYVIGNLMVCQGLTFKGIAWAFNGFHSYNWHPLTWLSHMLDCQLYGLHPGGHHLTNVLLHTATVIALFLVLRQMTGALWRSAFVAAVFAIHPLRVESVAWVAERKDVLSGLFFMLTIGAYVRYVREPWSWGRYGLVMLLIALGLMSKPMLVTLPVVLLLLDYWPLQRVEPGKLSWLVLEKLPLLALSAAACMATLLAQSKVMQSTASILLPERLGNALTACMVYLGQMVYPAGLAVFYPHPLKGLTAWEVVMAATLLAGLSAVALGWRRTQPWLLVGWVWYLVMLLPVVGIIQVGGQAHADRYTYLPQIGIYVALTWLAAEWGAKLHAGRVVIGGLMTAVLGALAVCAWQQTGYWKNSEILWIRAIACTTDNYIAKNGLGAALAKKGRDDEAIAHYQQALQIRPNFADAHFNFGIVLRQKGKLDEATAHFQQALEYKPDYTEARINLGNALLQKGRVDDAISEYQKALQTEPDSADAQYNLGHALLQKGRVDDAIADLQKALQINPVFAEAHFDTGNALLQKGGVDDAITEYQNALKIRPLYAEAHYNLGAAFLQKGRVDDAITQYQSALQNKPLYWEAHNNLGQALLQKGNVSEAITHFQQALQIVPDNPTIQNNLAWLLATCAEAPLRNGNKAVELAQRANALTGGTNPMVLHTLAAALAEAGRFSDARESVQKAIELARAAGQQNMVEQLKSELQRYEAGLPLHQ